MIAVEQAMARFFDIARVDRGRRIASVAKLAAGGAILTIAFFGLVLGILGSRPAPGVELILGLMGGAATFLYLERVFHVLGRQDK